MERIRIITYGTSAVRELVLDSLEIAPQFRFLAHSSNDRDLYELLKQHRPHVVLIEAVGDFSTVIGVIRLINTVFSESSVFILAHTLDAQQIQDALRSGAMAYLLWPIPSLRLASAIELVHAGKLMLSSEALSLLFPG